MSSPNGPQDHHPNLTVSDASDPGTPALPRDPNQPIHRKPRVFIHRPNEDPDEETQAIKDTSLITALGTVKVEDFSAVHKSPCFRDAVMPGIGGGIGLGVARFVVGGSVFAACNWASGSFLGISLVMYNYCQRRRRLEKEGIRKAVKVLDEKQRMKDAETAAAKAREASLPPSQRSDFWSTFKFW